jgi:hypothetical protein
MQACKHAVREKGNSGYFHFGEEFDDLLHTLNGCAGFLGWRSEEKTSYLSKLHTKNLLS